MNFLTMQTSTISSSSNYKSNATTLNKQLIDDLGDENGRLGASPLGIVFMDYCLNSDTNGDLSVYKVIENNFTRGKDAPVVRYQIDESIDWKPDPRILWQASAFSCATSAPAKMSNTITISVAVPTGALTP